MTGVQEVEISVETSGRFKEPKTIRIVGCRPTPNMIKWVQGDLKK